MSSKNNGGIIHKFSVGDTVSVRSSKEILQTLDPLNKLEGCLFMEQMYDYCNEKFTIIKIVKHIFDERECKIHRTLVPLYILEDLICQGKSPSLDYTCDHSCFFLWHEQWLTKS